MHLLYLLILFGVLILITLAGAISVHRIRTKGQVQRALNLSLLLVKVSRNASAAGDNSEKRGNKEFLNIAEQLFSSFSNIHSKGWNKFLFGEPYLSLEMAVHHVGQEIFFYIAIPKTNEDFVEKQIYAHYPDAEVSKIKDYNIFNPEGVFAGSYLKYTADSILPLKTYAKLEADPLGSILTSMSKLQAEGEGAAIQILIRPSHADKLKNLAGKVAREMQSGYQFKEAFRRVKYPPKIVKPDPTKPVQPERPKIITPADDEIIKAITTKASQQLFDINIRLISSALSGSRADQILKELEGAFVQYSAPNLNSLKAVKMSGRAVEKLAYDYSFRLFDNRQNFTVSTEEIASIYHFPLLTTASPRVKFVKSTQAEPPADLPQEGIILGRNIFRNMETAVRMTDEDRRRHLYMIGQTGTGKSTLMKALLRQDVENGKGVCLIDPHGEFAEFVLSIVPRDRAEDVIYFNPADIERPLGLNMLEIDPTKPEQKTFIANELLAIIKSIYKDLPEAFGPMFEQYFKNAILLLLDDYASEIPTLAEIPKVLADENYRRLKLSRETNPLVKNFWELEAEKAGGEAALANMVPYITSKLNPFLANDYVRPIVGQRNSTFNFREVIDNKKILIVNLSKGRVGDINANLLGMIIVSRLLMAALSRVDIVDERARQDFYLYIDEFQNFTTESIATILSEARKYRLDLIIAHQFIKQLQENIKNAVFGNVGSMAVFRIGADDAEFMKNKFTPVFTEHDLMSIDNLNAYVNLLINGQTTKPFNIKIETERVFGAGSKETAEAVRELSRMKYGRPKAEIEQDLTSRYQK